MQTGLPILMPCIDGILAERLALFLALKLLANSLPHYPVRGSLTRFCKALYAIPRILVDLDRYGAGGCGGHGALQFWYERVLLWRKLLIRSYFRAYFAQRNRCLTHPGAAKNPRPQQPDHDDTLRAPGAGTFAGGEGAESAGAAVNQRLRLR